MLKINHNPIFDTDEVAKIYSERDGIPVKYVCTSATQMHAAYAADIFYRDTPHPEYGNHYFAFYPNQFADDARIMITNADGIEKFMFSMLQGDDGLEYSQHRHDYREVNDYAIDGGRSYTRIAGDPPQVKTLILQHGEFVEVEENEKE